MKTIRLLLWGLCLLSLGLGASAQLSSDMLSGAARRAPELSYPSQVSTLGAFSSPTMALYKPDGPGPFPALVLHHQCGGLSAGGGRWQNQSMLEWARSAVRRGYVALLIDSLGPRGVDTVCMGPKGNVTYPRGARDALKALQHLQTFDFVDKNRIAHAGYSWGAMVGLALSGKTWGESLGDGARFQAAVAMYPGCFTLKPPVGPSYDLLNPDVDRPLLVLMGSADTETPPADCLPKLQKLKDRGAPVQWHVYEGMTHCFDCKNLDGFRKVDAKGDAVVYRYSEATTRDAEQRMFAFLEQVFQGRSASP